MYTLATLFQARLALLDLRPRSGTLFGALCWQTRDMVGGSWFREEYPHVKTKPFTTDRPRQRPVNTTELKDVERCRPAASVKLFPGTYVHTPFVYYVLGGLKPVLLSRGGNFNIKKIRQGIIDSGLSCGFERASIGCLIILDLFLNVSCEIE